MFTPFWITQTDFGTFSQGTYFETLLAASDAILTMIAPGEIQYNLGTSEIADRVTGVSISSIDVPFIISDNFVQFTAPNRTSTLEIFSNSPLSYRLLNGELPLGLQLSTTGILLGTFGPVQETKTFEFTVRATNAEGRSRDRTFTLSVEGIDRAGSFVETSLPAQIYSEELDLNYRPLGQYLLGSPFIYRFDFEDPDGVVSGFEILRVPGIPRGIAPVLHDGLPPGVEQVENVVKGIIHPQTAVGKYFFTVRLNDPVTPSEITFMVEVVTQLDPLVEIVPSITWVTPRGNLGSIVEGYASRFAVEAIVEGTDEYTYRLAPNSGALPEGMYLEETTGLIIGIAHHIQVHRTYEFTVRVSIGVYFEDRKFSITVRNRYNSSNLVDLYFRFMGQSKQLFYKNYQPIVEDDEVFRKIDPHFGVSVHPLVYLIKSLDGSGDLLAALEGDGSPVRDRKKDFHAPFDVILGDHHSAVVRNELGEVVYEVIYRPLFDPSTKAGGFESGASTVPNKVVWAQSPTNETKYVFPSSINNVRKDFVNNIGFPVNNPTFRNVLGINTMESLPDWMTSEQILGDPTSVIGYVPAIVVAYVVPGKASVVLKRIQKNINVLADVGKIFTLDRYYRSTTATIQTLFDGGDTVFDGQPFTPDKISFDNTVGDDGKYYERIDGNKR